jgi:hypothetical protein
VLGPSVWFLGWRWTGGLVGGLEGSGCVVLGIGISAGRSPGS